MPLAFLVGLTVIEIGRERQWLSLVYKMFHQNASFFHRLTTWLRKEEISERAKNRALFKEGLILLSQRPNNISETGGKADKMDLTACTPWHLERICPETRVTPASN